MQKVKGCIYSNRSLEMYVHYGEVYFPSFHSGWISSLSLYCLIKPVMKGEFRFMLRCFHISSLGVSEVQNSFVCCLVAFWHSGS